MKTYDVVVLGSGTAGQTAAYDLSAEGLRVALSEPSDRPGGTCALSGCQAKKWFYEAAETVARSRHLEGEGIAAAPEGRWGDVLRQKNAFTDKVPERTKKGLSSAGIDFLPAKARFEGPDRIRVGKDAYAFDAAVIATGASPAPLPFPGAGLLTTSDRFLELERLPRRVVFVGGGFISFELAHFAARLGAAGIETTILEVADRPLAPFDAQMVSLLVEAGEADGIRVRAGVTVSAVEKTPEGYLVRLEEGGDIEADLVVHGAGRSAVVGGLDLEKAGVEHGPKGIWVDERMRTTNDRIYAVGDCAATMQLARVADLEAHVAAAGILGKVDGARPRTMDYGAVPAVLFTYPQYAMVGKTEEDLVAEGVDFRKSAGDHIQWPTYTRVGMDHAAYKILADAEGRILGAHVISDQPAGLINTFRQAMRSGTTAETLYWENLVGPYPSRESDIVYMLKPLAE